ncbi:hypothetical protein LBMAG53_25640 [Planctomycetota bacterium]|nr:hypothetical protein LBMAG53_25640 [Planctomycetota bacterium]
MFTPRRPMAYDAAPPARRSGFPRRSNVLSSRRATAAPKGSRLRAASCRARPGAGSISLGII